MSISITNALNEESIHFTDEGHAEGSGCSFIDFMHMNYNLLTILLFLRNLKNSAWD